MGHVPRAAASPMTGLVRTLQSCQGSNGQSPIVSCLWMSSTLPLPASSSLQAAAFPHPSLTTHHFLLPPRLPLFFATEIPHPCVSADPRATLPSPPEGSPASSHLFKDDFTFRPPFCTFALYPCLPQPSLARVLKGHSSARRNPVRGLIIIRHRQDQRKQASSCLTSCANQSMQILHVEQQGSCKPRTAGPPVPGTGQSIKEEPSASPKPTTGALLRQGRLIVKQKGWGTHQHLVFSPLQAKLISTSSGMCQRDA